MDIRATLKARERRFLGDMTAGRRIEPAVELSELADKLRGA
ncbi:MAG: hypothetical protein AABZ23_05550 [Deltaproteobacteria bacterium]